MNHSKSILCIAGFSLAVALADTAISCKSNEQPAPPPAPQTQPADPQTDKPIKRNPQDLAVRINGVSIYEKDLLDGIPADAFEDVVEKIRFTKLRQFAHLIFAEQLLRDRNINVTPQQIDENMSWFEKKVTGPGCPDCNKGFANLDQFKQAHGFTPADLRRTVRVEVGLRLYADQMMKERMEPDALAKAVKELRPGIEQEYVKGAVMQFNFTPKNSSPQEVKAAMAAKQKLANQAWQRLQANEPFDVVARSMSDDAETAARGGKLGVVLFRYLGYEIEPAWRKLEPGKYSEPICTSWSYAIVLREKLSDDDILSLIKEQARPQVNDAINRELYALRAKARYEYADTTTRPTTQAGAAKPADTPPAVTQPAAASTTTTATANQGPATRPATQP